MVEYGFMEGTYLRSKLIEPIVKNMIGSDGKVQQIVVTIEEQIKNLSSKWKPVELIDDTLMVSQDDDYVIVPIPYDAGDRIAYKYQKKFDRKKIVNAIQTLKDSLSSSDYQILKCYEASMLGETMPYDMQHIISVRKELRIKINSLEQKLSSNA